MYVAHLRLFFFVEKNKQKRTPGPKMGICRTRVHHFSVYTSKTAGSFGLLHVKMSRIRYIPKLLGFSTGSFFFAGFCKMCNTQARQIDVSLFARKLF